MSELTTTEMARLHELEGTISRGLATFHDVGRALAEVRDSRLYRDGYGTFEEYCDQRWQLSDRRARQLMEAAEIGTMVPVENERQARELARVPERQRAEVWRETVERTSGKPTAAAIRETFRSSTPAPLPAPPEREPGISHNSGPLADEQPTPGPEPGLAVRKDQADAAVEQAVRSVNHAIARHLCPGLEEENRTWRRNFLAAISAARKPLQFRPAEVAARADGECLDELDRFAADLSRYHRDVKAAGTDADVIQMGVRR